MQNFTILNLFVSVLSKSLVVDGTPFNLNPISRLSYQNFALRAGDANYSELMMIQSLAYFNKLMELSCDLEKS